MMLQAFNATEDSIIWIQAWGGDGATGSVFDVLFSQPGSGGCGGYAQTVTTLNDIQK